MLESREVWLFASGAVSPYFVALVRRHSFWPIFAFSFAFCITKQGTTDPKTKGLFFNFGGARIGWAFVSLIKPGPTATRTNEMDINVPNPAGCRWQTTSDIFKQFAVQGCKSFIYLFLDVIARGIFLKLSDCQMSKKSKIRHWPSFLSFPLSLEMYSVETISPVQSVLLCMLPLFCLDNLRLPSGSHPLLFLSSSSLHIGGRCAGIRREIYGEMQY